MTSINSLDDDFKKLGIVRDKLSVVSIEERSRRSRGKGVVAKIQPKKFKPHQIDKAFNFFNKNGFVVIENAYTKSEVEFLNNFFDETQYKYPRAWGELKKRPFYALGHPKIYSQPLLDHPELDKYTMHPNTFPLVNKLMNYEARYSQFDFRDVPPGSGPLYKTSRFHHDRALDGRFFRKRGEPIDDVCCIHYLSVVDENTPSFCVVPRSNKFRSLKEAYNGLGSEYIEIPIYGSAGTCILYDISIYHTKLDGKDPKGRRRRTVHQYFARGGWIGIRPPTPTLTNWTLIPKRLCMSKDPIKRKFFSHWNTAQCEWVASDFSIEVRASHPRAIGPDFLGFNNKFESEQWFKERNQNNNNNDDYNFNNSMMIKNNMKSSSSSSKL